MSYPKCPDHHRHLLGSPKVEHLWCPVNGCEHTRPKPQPVRDQGYYSDDPPAPDEPARIPESPWRDRDTCEHGTPLTIPSGERLVCPACSPDVEVGPAPDPTDAARWRELREGLAS